MSIEPILKDNQSANTQNRIVDNNKWTCVDKRNYISEKELTSMCDSAWDKYRSEMKDVEEKIQNRTDKYKDKYESAMEKYTKEQAKGKERLEELTDKINELDQKHNRDFLEETAKKNKEQMTLEEQLRSAELEISDLESQRLLGRQAYNTAYQNKVMAENESADIIQINCMLELQKVKKSSGGTIAGGISGANAGSNLMSRVFTACIQREMNKRTSEIQKMTNEFQKSDVALRSIDKRIELARDKKASLVKASNQTDALNTQSRSQADYDYQTQRQTMINKMQTALTNNTNELNRLKGIVDQSSTDLRSAPYSRNLSNLNQLGNKVSRMKNCCSRDNEDNDPEDLQACPSEGSTMQQQMMSPGLINGGGAY